jgi:hypothetical protein
MAGVTRYGAFPIERRAIQLEHHSHHVAPHCLFLFVLSFPKPGVFSGLRVLLTFDVAMITINAKRIANEVHEKEQLGIRQSFEDLNVLPDLFDRFVACRLGLSGLCFPTDHQKNEEEHDAQSACDF